MNNDDDDDDQFVWRGRTVSQASSVYPDEYPTARSPSLQLPHRAGDRRARSEDDEFPPSAESSPTPNRPPNRARAVQHQPAAGGGAAARSAPRQSSGRLSRARDWVATYTGANPFPGGLPAGVDFVEGQQEQGRESQARGQGELHWQLYIEFNQPVSMVQAQRILGWSWDIVGPDGKYLHPHHLDIRRGTQEQARKYVSKEDTRVDDTHFVLGVPHRADAPGTWDQLASAVREGSTLRDIAADPRFTAMACRAGHGIQKVIETLAEDPPEFRDVTVSIFYGPTGTGKSHAARQNCDGDYYSVPKPESNGILWFTNKYVRQRRIIFDDFNCDVPIEKLLLILDKYQLDVQCKGGHLKAWWTEVIFTTNIPFENWYPLAAPAHKEALARRIPVENRQHFTTVYSRPPRPLPSAPPSSPSPSPPSTEPSVAPHLTQVPPSPLVLKVEERTELKPLLEAILRCTDQQARDDMLTALISLDRLRP